MMMFAAEDRKETLDLAAELRAKVFREVIDKVALIVSSDVINKTYLSGDVSLAHDLSIQNWGSCLARARVAVTRAADAAPALDLLRDPSLIYRYGVFHFMTIAQMAFARPASEDFNDAFAEALRMLRPKSGLIGVDRGNDDLL